MRRAWLALRVVLFVIVFVARRAVGRVLRGAAVASWSWSTELTVASIRGFILGAMRYTDRPGRQELEAMLDPPLPRRYRRLIRIDHTTLGGVRVERLTRLGDLRDVATLLYLHGGAYVAGSPATHRAMTSELTWSCRVGTVVPAYRLAPQHPFPAGLDDAEAVYRELLHAGTDPRHIIVAGDSAGGGLALALLYRLRDRNVPLPAGAVLFSPYTDLLHTAPSIWENVGSDYLPDRETDAAEVYLGGADPRDPYASPLYGDLSGLPSILVFAGSAEMIRDDSTRLAAKAAEAGADLRLHLEPDMFHVWPAVVPMHPASQRAFAKTAEFVAERVGKDR